MKFLRDWKIDIEKVPNYALFNKPFTEQIDLHLAKQILLDIDNRLTIEIKSEFQKMVDLPKKQIFSKVWYRKKISGLS